MSLQGSFDSEREKYTGAHYRYNESNSERIPLGRAAGAEFK
jgi:hypothetical protein